MSTAFPQRLLAARELRKLSQTDLAAKAKLQPSAISHFETGRRSPSFDNLKALSVALEVTTDYLLGRVDEPEAVGTVTDSLFRDLKRLSAQDQDTLRQMAKFLAERPNQSGKTK
jgi:transcriptional regulator with XRE-family HTH domain